MPRAPKVDPQDVISCGIFVAVTPTMKTQLRDLAESEHRTLTGLVRLLIQQRLDQRQRRQQQRQQRSRA